MTPIGAESGLLRDGRFAAEVLQAHDDGTVLLRVGSERVPAKTEVPLAPGDNLSLMAEHRDGEVLLRVLPRGPAVGERLARILGGLIAESRDAGTQHARLEEALRGVVQGVRDPGQVAEARDLLRALSSAVFQPGETGAELASKLGGGGQVALATLLAAALATRDADSLETLLKRLAAAIRGRLVAPLSPAGAVLEAEALGTLLPGLLERALREAREGAGDLRRSRGLRAFLGRLEGALARLVQGEQALPHELRERVLAQLSRGGVFEGRETAILRALALLDGSSALSGGTGAAALAELDSDPLGRLFASLFSVEDPEAREALQQRFTGRALEQLLNAARQSSGELLHHAIPLPDAGGFTTAHLFVGPDHQRDSMGQLQSGYRVVLGVDFSRLGPIRADLLLWQERLTVRLHVAQQDVADRLRLAASALEQQLAAAGVAVQLSVLDALEPEEASVDELIHDIRYLHEHRLVDLEG